MNLRVVFFSGVVLILLVMVAYTTLDNKPEPIPTPQEESQILPTGEQPVMKSFMDPETGVSFMYRESPDGYTLSTHPGERPTHVKTLVLSPTDDLPLPSAEAQEYPPSITISVYQNTLDESPRSWAEAHPQESNYGLIQGDIKEAVIGGVDSVEYLADGLYRIDTYVVTNGAFVYVIGGAYLDQNSITLSDFVPFLSTITFLPREES
jgi:hypothetical protein